MLTFPAAVAAAALTLPPQETAIEAPGPAGALRGTISGEAAGAPVVLIIPGSGPTDRDGNNPLGVKAATYRLLAEGLAERGITSVRIDKRGMFASAGATPDANAVTIPDYVADTRSWIKAIQARTGASCVWLFGHSEGGLVALAAAEQTAGICGIILASAPGRPVGMALREQLRANPANEPLLEQAFAAIGALEAGKRVDTTNLHPALMPLFAPQVQGMMISLLSYDPAVLLAKYPGSVLVLQGTRDIQVSVDDALRLKAARAGTKLALLPDVNHVLKAVTSDDRGANVATYADPALPLAAGVVDTVADFVRPRK
ncbi:MAG TPA: alpha/beta fold hydrolase [Allosphingosinicella sp.]